MKNRLIRSVNPTIAGVQFCVLLVCISIVSLFAGCASGGSGGGGGVTTYTIGGTVSGLSGTGLVLQDNGGNNLTITANGTFTFSMAIASGDNYDVTVLTQPSSPAQTCSVTNGSGTLAANVTNVQVACVTPVSTYTIGGTISGLTGTGLVLQDNGGNNTSVSANGSFTFSTAIASGDNYEVTVLTQPSNPTQTCSVTNGSGTATADVTNVQVACVTPVSTYTIGGTISGLTGTGLVLQDNGGNNTPISTNGSFTFSTAITSGDTYDVTVLTQPANPVESCAVSNGSGTATANVTNVQVTCSAVTYTIGGTVSGLTGTGLVLQDNGGNNLSVTADGDFTFTTAIASGGAYSVTVLTQPVTPAQICAVTGASGTATADVTSVAVACTAETSPISGQVESGQNPVSSAQVYLYAANTTGYGNASVSLLTSPETTDSDGKFTIPGGYTCPSGNPQVYLYASGGNAGSGVNSALGLLAGLGYCGVGATNVVVNEVSTVATAYAIAGFATDATDVSSSGSQLATQWDVPNAFKTVANLETLGTGAALAATPAGNGTVPQATIDTLANILNSCVNSSGPGSDGCSALLGGALASGTSGTAPTDTATAAINIAHNPWANISTLYPLQTSTSPFKPALTGAPNDFTIDIVYTTSSNGCFSPDFYAQSGPAIDSSGNVWVLNWAVSPCPTQFSISELSSTGVPNPSSPFTGGGLSSPDFIAVDGLGNVWVADEGDITGGVGWVSKFNSSGTPESSSSGITGGLNDANALAIDASNNVWVTGYNNSTLVEFNQSGSSIFSTTLCDYVGGDGADDNSFPEDVAIDVSGNVWVPARNGLCEYSSSGSMLSPSPNGYIFEPPEDYGFDGVAFDGSGNLWAPFAGYSRLFEISSSGADEANPYFTGGGMDAPKGVAIDGSGNVWVTNSGINVDDDFVMDISEFNSSGAPITGSSGYQIGTYGSENPAIDGSGNVWVEGAAYPSGIDNLVEMVGAATPVVTPIAANLQPPYAANKSAVNKP